MFLSKRNGIYYVFYPDQKKEMTKKEREDYDYIQGMPDTLRYKMLAELDPSKDPNVLQVKGRVLIEFSERGWIPMFDVFFGDISIELWWKRNPQFHRNGKPKPTRRLTFMPLEGYEFYREWSYFMNKRRRKLRRDL